MDLLWIYYVRSIQIKNSYDIIISFMTGFKDTIYNLELSENFLFLMSEKIIFKVNCLIHTLRFSELIKYN
ncbi:hypothetical protein LCGC14_1440580 [marine sediment metagenome]|uniref:Uncharacterized protein n=1 Tax=marine sediment metagenome TaxID=412755 RepID=A0A0F9M1D8_9ZZZZ